MNESDLIVAVKVGMLANLGSAWNDVDSVEKRVEQMMSAAMKRVLGYCFSNAAFGNGRDGPRTG